MSKVALGEVIQKSIVTAITLTAALIWKDILVEMIELLVPPDKELLYKAGLAAIVTSLLIVAIYPLLKTESEAEKVLREIRRHHHK